MPKMTLLQQDEPKGDKSTSAYKLLWSGLILLQWFLFRAYILREIAWAYPVNYDQSDYLFLSYRHFETLLQTDLLSGLSAIIFTPNSNGIFLHLQTIPLFFLFGASRLTALSANFLNFVLYQAVFALVIKRLTGSQSLALLAVGLLLGLGTPFFWAGGVMDYRLDFAAFCLFGIFISVVMQSEIFRAKKWALAAGFVAGLLILTRFITAVYLVGIYGLIFVYFLIMELRTRKPQSTFVRVKHVLLSGIICAITAGPFLWLNRNPIYNYYFVYQQGVNRFVRARETGTEDWLASLLFYPNSIIQDHFTLNLAIICLALLILGAALAYSLTRGRVISNTARPGSFPFGDAYIFLGFCFLFILTVLSALTAKSPVVGGILTPLLLWLVVLTFFYSIKTGLAIDKSGFRRVILAAAVLCLGYGIYHQAANLGRHGLLTSRRHEVRAIEELYEAIGTYSEQMRWPAPAISTDRVVDYLAGRTVAVRYYEEHGVFIDIEHLLGRSIPSVTTDAILEQLERSDFVILTHAEVESPYPFYESIKAARPLIETFAREHFVRLNRFSIYGNNVDLYARPSFSFVNGVSGDQIISDRLTLSLPSQVAAAASEIILTGPVNPWISPETTVSCTLFESDNTTENLAVELTVTADQYAIHCYLPDKLNRPTSEEVHIGLNFSLHFVPEMMGSNSDGRQLAVAVPTQRIVVLKPLEKQ